MSKYHSAIVWTDDPKDWAEYLRKPTQQEIDEVYQGILLMEQNGTFDDMFAGQCKQTAELPTKEKLLESIRPDMKLYKSTFMKIYGYEITYPGFAEIALAKLEDIGCQRAREYYEQFTTEYEKEYHDKLIEVSEWYQKKLDDEWERKERTGEKLRNEKYLSSSQPKNYSQRQKESSVDKLKRLKALI